MTSTAGASTIKRALAYIEKLEAEIDRLKTAPKESIAIVGLACRLPGGVNDGQSFWTLLREGREAISEVPADRWDIEAYYDADPEAPGKMYTRYAGFMDQVDQFDAEFFQISPREAMKMDPQHRLLLELSWEALESGGFRSERLKGSRTGVYVGICSSDYADILKEGSEQSIDAYMATGVAHSTAVGRISYVLGLKGPSVAIDTACSSSLVALHQACQDLLTNQSDLALAGGVNVILKPQIFINFCKAGMLAADGRCKTFDEAADGYVRAEGGGVVVLKRLSEAKFDGDRILAVIRGSAINQDGASAGLTAPNGPAQEGVIRTALQRAGVNPNEVAYLEAHGTGTSLGDPIEVQAAAAVLGEGRATDRPLLIGSVKTNIGHLEAAAGIAGLIKVIMAMEHAVIPKHLHFSQPNSHIPWERLPVTVTSEATPWPEGKKIAGISSFGFSGTNAHVIVEEAPATEGVSAYRSGSRRSVSASLQDSLECFAPEEHQDLAQGFNPGSTIPSTGVLPARGSFGNRDEGGKEAQEERTYDVLTLSARNDAALKELAGRYRDWLSEHPGADIADVAYTLGTGRSHFLHRAALMVSNEAEACERLSTLVESVSGAELLAPEVFYKANTRKPKVAWLFTGQGSQYAGMGRELYQSQPVVREVLDRCERLLKDGRERSLLKVLFEREEDLNQTRYTQPALYALEIAIAELLKSWGQEPDVVLGHSVGQYAAAVVAGIMSLEDGFRLIAKRAELMGRLPAGGAMAAVFCDLDTVNEIIAEESALSLAAYNGAHLVLSGPEDALERVLTILAQQGIPNRRLNTSHGFHSALMEPMLEEFELYAAGIEYRPAQCSLICNLTGKELVARQVLEAAYWTRHIREPVQFAGSVGTLSELEIGMLVEVGPQPVLLAIVEGCWPSQREPPVAVATLRREHPERRQMTQAAAQMYVNGLTLEEKVWQKSGERRRKLSLPTYPFQRSRCWVIREQESLGSQGGVGAPLLGVRHESATGEVNFTQWIGCAQQPWLVDHQVFDRIIVPGALYLATALRAAGKGGTRLSGGIISRALQLENEEALCQVQLVLKPNTEHDGQEEKSQRFELYSKPWAKEGPGGWTLHAEGMLEPLAGRPGQKGLEETLKQIKQRLDEQSVENFYSHCAEVGLRFGPCFQGVQTLWSGEGEALGEIVLAAGINSGPIHPTQLDACLQLMAVAGQTEELYVPFEYQGVELWDPVPERFYCYGRVCQRISSTKQEQAPETLQGDLWLVDEEERLIGRISGLVLKRATVQNLLAKEGTQNQAESWLYEVNWQEQSRTVGSVSQETEASAAGGWWLVASDQRGVGGQLAERLRGQGQHCVLVEPGTHYNKQADGTYQLAGEQAADWERLLLERGNVEQPLKGIVHLWSMDATATQETESERLLRDIRHSCASVLGLVQALGRCDVEPPSGLWLVTQGAQSVISNQYPVISDQHSAIGTQGGEHTDYCLLNTDYSSSGSLAQSPLWGLGKVIALEHSELSCRRVDLESGGDISWQLDQLAAELVDPDAEDQIAWRASRRFVPRLLPCTQSRQSKMTEEGPLPAVGRLDGKAMYLITGGLGGLGLEVARWLVEQGVRHLILNGRRAPGVEVEAKLDHLRQIGAEVDVVLADVAQEVEVIRLLAAIEKTGRPLAGVFHLAGVLRDGALVNQNWQDFEEVLAPKVLGAWHLHRLTLERAPELFVLFSSMTSLLGNHGQGNYAAANQFLDKLAQYRRAMGLPAKSINWGPWSEAGMAARYQSQLQGRSHQNGLGWISPKRGLELLQQLLTSDSCQTGVLPINWERYSQNNSVDRLFLAELAISTRTHSQRNAGEQSHPPFRLSLDRLSSKEQLPLLIEHLKEEVMHVLQLRLPPYTDTPFAELGMDSLMAVEFRNQINRDLRIKPTLPITAVFDFPNVESLAREILTRLTPISDQLEGLEAKPNSEPLEISKNALGQPNGSFDKSNKGPTDTNLWIVRRKKPGDASIRLFCIPAAGLSASQFRGWEELLPAGTEVCALQLPGRGNRLKENPIDNLPELIDVLDSILTPELNIPYAFYGHSMGGMIAYHLAYRFWQRDGPMPLHLFVGAYPSPVIRNPTILEELRKRLRAGGFVGIPDPHHPDKHGGASRVLQELVITYWNRVYGKEFSITPGSDGAQSTSVELVQTVGAHASELADAFLKTGWADLRIADSGGNASPEPFDVPITAFHGADDEAVSLNEVQSWRQLTGSDFQCHILSGNHFFLHEGQSQHVLLDLIGKALGRSRSSSSAIG
jgi:acyl transferase domain-containing protein/surfactin synthase thioesterase subunit